MKQLGKVGAQRAKALRALRPSLMARAGGRCEVPWCRRRGRLDAHHVVKRSQGGRDEPDNLVLVCRSCHDMTDRRHGIWLDIIPHQIIDAFLWTFTWRGDDGRVVRQYKTPMACPVPGGQKSESG